MTVRDKKDASASAHAPAQTLDLHRATLHLLTLLDSQKLEHDLLQDSIESLTALIGARYGAIALVDTTGSIFQFVHTGITPEQADRIGPPPQGHGLLGTVMRRGETLRLNDLTGDPRSVGFPSNHPPMKNLLVAPIIRENQVFGRVYLSEKKDTAPFSDSDETLMRQYADALAFALAYHRTRADRDREKQILQQVAQAIAGVTGREFFRELVVQLTHTLNMDHAFVGELTEDGEAVQTLANCVHGRIADNLVYRLPGTPCAGVVGKDTCFYASGIQQMFPDDRLLVDMGIESYIGSPLFDSNGKPLGILVMLGGKPLANPERAEVILRICAARAAAELERQRASNALRENNEILERIFDSTQFCVVYLDREFNFIRVNQAYAKACGYPREYFLGKNHFHLYPQEENEAIFRRVVKTGEPFTITAKPFQFPDHPEWGVTYWDWTLHPLKDHKGNVETLLFVLLDVTERWRGEDTQARLGRILDSSSNEIYVFGSDDLHFIQANHGARQNLGYTMEQLRRMTPLDIKPEFTRKSFEKLLAPLRHGERETITFTTHHRRNDGSLYPIEARLQLSRAENPPVFVANIQDITDRLRSEQALRKSEASLAHAQRIAHIGNWERNLATNELHWSDETYRIFGLTPEQPRITFTTFLNLIHPDDRQSVIEDVSKAIDEKRSYGTEFRLVRPDGTERIVHAQAEIACGNDGEPARLIGTIQDITDQRRTQERLNYLAHYDTLTGLPNRILLQDRLSQAMVEADRRDRLVALMFLDLDRFKIINDTLGHETGDALLKSVAERLRSCVRAGDTISRLGGDEFTIVLANIAHVDDVAHVAQKIIDGFVAPFHVNGRELFISPSIGITLYPFDDNDIDSLLRNADAAMYHAKELGRNTFQFYTAELNRRTAKRLRLETALRHALERNELLLHFQPQVSLKTGRVIGAEALLRWQHAEMGLISPLEFIPLAEETGLITSIGEWVLHSACTQARIWHEAGFGELQIAVNLSGRQFQHQNLAKLVKKVLKETGLDPRQLDLELTESLLMHNTDSILGIMEELHAHGVAFSMDDFGIGYSSLSYLKRFPIDTIKIDQSFVRDIPRDPDDAAIAQAIIAMAHNLNIRVIAEGVETARQLAFLRSKRCDGMQGYYFSKPIPAEALTRLLQKNQRLKNAAMTARLRNREGKRRRAATTKKRPRRRTR